jgi:hypothetical protein
MFSNVTFPAVGFAAQRAALRAGGSHPQRGQMSPAPVVPPPGAGTVQTDCHGCKQQSTTETPPANGAKPRVDMARLQRVLDSTTVASLVGSKMKAGEKVTIESDGKVVLEVEKKGVTAYDRIKTMASDVFTASSAEVSNVVGQDPAFAFKESALAVQTQVFQGIPQNFQDLAGQAFLPMVRVVALALDSKKAMDTWKSASTSMVDKVIDGGHLLTDIAGVAGAVSMAIPSIAPHLAVPLTVAGLLGDVGAYGYHVMKYFKERGQQVPDPDPNPNPNPDPNPNPNPNPDPNPNPNPNPTPDPNPAPPPDPNPNPTPPNPPPSKAGGQTPMATRFSYRAYAFNQN